MKKKQSENYLEYVPVRTPETEFTVDETGIVTLTKEWTGFYNRIAQRFFHKPRVSHIALDGYGSFIWKLIDGERDVYAISQKLDTAYPGMDSQIRLVIFDSVTRIKVNDVIRYFVIQGRGSFQAEQTF